MKQYQKKIAENEFKRFKDGDLFLEIKTKIRQ